MSLIAHPKRWRLPALPLTLLVAAGPSYDAMHDVSLASMARAGAAIVASARLHTLDWILAALGIVVLTLWALTIRRMVAAFQAGTAEAARPAPPGECQHSATKADLERRTPASPMRGGANADRRSRPEWPGRHHGG